jgi:hypothetical protein
MSASKTSGNQGTLTGVFNAIMALLKNGPTKTPFKMVTRPANTTQYAVGDVIGNSGQMETLDITAGSIWIVGGQSVCSRAQSSLQYDCLFFKTAFPVAADNVVFAPTDDQIKDNYLGRISFSSFLQLSVNSICDGAPASTKPIAVQPQDKKVYYVRVATTAYSPSSEEKISDQFDLQRN